jgi:uncharacterized protein DUF4411
MAYLLDANVFIAANKLHYGLDFCPAFWDWLVRENKHGTVFSIEKVGNEIIPHGDDLAKCAAQRGDGFFLKPDSSLPTALARVAQWVSGENFKPAAVSTFLQGADYYLIAQALALKRTVVTHEKPANTPNNVKIPVVCLGVGVKCVSPFEMLRLERAKFILQT